MRKILLMALLVLMPLASHSAPLDGLQWKKRVLVLFDQSRSSATLDRQVDLLRERRPDVSDRDLIVLVNAGDRDTAVAMGYVDLPDGTARILHRTYQPADRGITMILLGKDGLEKMRWSHVTDPQVVFDLIDSMPMRQREMVDES